MANKVKVIPATISRRTAQRLDEQRCRRVAAYARVSTDRDEQLTSYAAQVDYYSRYIKERDDWEFAGIYTDAVNVCGGLLPTADEKAVNMAQVLKDGAQLQVPVKGAAGAGGSGKDSSGRVSINTADEKALDTLPGIGPAMARRIVEYRQSNGGFQSLEDLKKVKGIGAAKFEKLKDKVCL